MPQSPVDHVSGDFRCGRLVSSHLHALSSWRVTCANMEIATAISRHLGGAPQKWTTTGVDNIEVLTSSPSVDILISNPSAITVEMRLWGHRGLIHHCDGIHLLSPNTRKGKACGCPFPIRERRALAKEGKGPQVMTDILFRLASAPDLGNFRLRSYSWRLAESIDPVRKMFHHHAGSITYKLTLAKFDTIGGSGLYYREPTLLPIVHS
ncbi:recombination directionality factor [Streptomyces sp. NPDC054933]